MSNDKFRKAAERDIAAHMLAIRDIARDYEIFQNGAHISAAIFEDSVSFFALDDDDEKLVDFFINIATEVL